MEQKQETLLEIHDLSVSFRMYDAGLEQKDLQVISDLHLRIRPGEIVAVAGSSGSGKSLLASAILGILPANATVRGHVHYRGKELTPEMQRELRGKEIALVPQSVAYLDPLMRVGKQVDGHRRPKPTEKRRSLFRRLELPERTETLYPFQLSGGMARRVLVSTALLTEASLVIADEPTPGMSLDQALEALRMFREMADAGKSVLLITHDIDLAFEFADRVAVFYAGTTVEIAPVEDFRTGPQALRHPYSQALWRALPQNGFTPIDGFQPYAGSLPRGCLFAPRCPYATDRCRAEIPPVREVRGGEVRCFHGA
ncbi:MAG TPA: ABC transporter ATP-binding protein [Candidatus Avoscillospira stercorigallinarum]|uniref:Nickel import system ATP-binding protein NikD n=1 Tax=Candidatus Avoscillospira stercorigallinarum TaxID=2840708 RepID=A0A9D1CPG6_9FIRM|nr:ABC transporter ATP-binding protein [Candidatus Avoscillospira stercorigallinarum]